MSRPPHSRYNRPHAGPAGADVQMIDKARAQYEATRPAVEPAPIPRAPVPLTARIWKGSKMESPQPVKVRPGPDLGLLRDEPAYKAGWLGRRDDDRPDPLSDDPEERRQARCWEQGWHDARKA